MTDTELVARLERLERDNRRLKRVALGALVLMVASVGLGAAYAKPAVPQKIVAHEFDVLGRSGKVQLRMGVNVSGEPDVSLFDGAGTERTTMTLYGDGSPVVALRNSSGMVRAEIDDRRGPSISLLDTDGKRRVILTVFRDSPYLWLTDAQESERAEIGVTPSGSGIVKLSDQQGFEMDLGSASEVEATTGATKQTSADSIVMFGNGKKHHVIWEAPR